MSAATVSPPAPTVRDPGWSEYVRLPQADRRRARRTQLIVAGVTLVVMAGLGWLGYVWWPQFLASHVQWDTQPLSPNKHWQWRESDTSGFGPDSGLTTWVQVRRAGTSMWRTAYAGSFTDVSWKGDTILFTDDTTGDLITTVDAPSIGRGIGLPSTVGLPPVIVTMAASIGLLFILLTPGHLARRRAKVLVEAALQQLKARRWAQAAEHFLLSGAADRDHAADELAGRLATCQATVLLERSWRVGQVARARMAGQRAWQVTVRFPHPWHDSEVCDEATVVATETSWLLLPDAGLFAIESQVTQQSLSVSQKTDPATVAGLLCGIGGLVASFVPLVGALAGLLDVVAIALATTGLVAARRRGAPLAAAIVALAAGCLGLLVALTQVFILSGLWSLPNLFF